MDALRNTPRARSQAIRVAADTPVEWAVAYFCRQPGGFALESAAAGPSAGRWTLVGCEPIESVCVEAGAAPDPLAVWLARAEALPVIPSPVIVPFAGGWVGFISYEAGLHLDTMVTTFKAHRLLPDVRFSLYETVAVYDHTLRKWFAAGTDCSPASGVHDAFESRAPLPDRLEWMADRVRHCPEPVPIDHDRTICEPPASNMTEEQYVSKVAQAKAYIEAGDVYQVNLTQRFATTTDASPLEIYRRLRCANPAAFAACLTWSDCAVLSASPELFLDVRGRHVSTRPIKGTRPRVGDAVLDASRREELIHSEKDRAELNMIIDLLRNDLGRVCRYGSVRVHSPGDIEEHPTVYHRVATIVGELAPRRTWADLLRATFPGGSITGAPKIRAVQIIDELEPTPRDVYCGSIGYVGLDGSMTLNIAIRTIVMRGPSLYLYAGGGIVADSDPWDEYEETLAKAAGMMHAIGHEPLGTADARSRVPTHGLRGRTRAPRGGAR